MRISAKTDYAIRAAIELAGKAGTRDLLTADEIAEAQHIPPRFLLNILAELRRVGLVESRRGPEGGWRLATTPDRITVADLIRSIDGPLANVAGVRPDQLDYQGSAAPLQQMWIALRVGVRDVLEATTLADLAADTLPDSVQQLTKTDGAWESH